MLLRIVVKLLGPLVLWACSLAPAMADTWQAEQLVTVMGESALDAGNLRVIANEQGQGMVAVAADGLSLDDMTHINVRFAGPTPVQLFVIWRNDRADALQQKGFLVHGNHDFNAEMSGVPGWEGLARSLELGFISAPGQPVSVQSVAIYRENLWHKVSPALKNWRSFAPWRPLDVNLYTGTAVFGQGPHPAPVMALLMGSSLLAYGLFVRRRWRWQQAALIVFLAWLALDVLWQYRLWQQVGVTRDTFAKLPEGDKFLAADDAPVFELVRAARAEIGTGRPRLFIASGSDYAGMLAAYHAAPLNTYWNRKVHELPAASYLRPGDMILLQGSHLVYGRKLGLIANDAGEHIEVKERLAHPSGYLVEVK